MTSISFPPAPPSQGSNKPGSFFAFTSLFGKSSSDYSISSSPPTSATASATIATPRRRWSQTPRGPPITADEAMNLARATSLNRHKAQSRGSVMSDGAPLSRVVSADGNYAASGVTNDSSATSTTVAHETTRPTNSSSTRTESALSSVLAQRRASSLSRTRRNSSGASYQGIGLVAAYSGPSAF